MGGGQTKAEARRRRRKRDRAPALLRMGHETMLSYPAVRDGVAAIVRKLRVPPGEEPVLPGEADMLACPEVEEMIQSRMTVCRHRYGWGDEDCLVEAQQVLTHARCAAGFELAGRKAFWVSEELAEQLRHTELDVSGEALRLPFPACAFCFTDATTLELVAAAASTARDTRFEVLSVYAFPAADHYDGREGLSLVFLADRLDGQWPYMIARELITDGARNLDEILDSHPDDSTDPFFRSPELKALVKLVINAVLYTTSASFDSRRVAPVPRSRARFSARPLTGETVFFLPGRVRIVRGEGDEGVPEAPVPANAQRQVLKRFWVRGHWRRPNPTWQDQRLRWVQPYLKGPDAAVVIERQYQVG